MQATDRDGLGALRLHVLNGLQCSGFVQFD